MTFIEYLKSKRNLILIFVLFNFAALFLNIFEIEGDVSPRNIITEKYEEFAGVYLFTNTYVEHKSDKPSSHFWPFVQFYRSQKLYNPYNGSKSVFSSFNGIFYKYDISEFLAYIFIFVGLLYARWNIKYNKYEPPSLIQEVRIKNQNNPNKWFELIQYKKKNSSITNGLTIPYLVGAYSLHKSSKNKDALVELITDISDAQNDQKAVLQYCGDINEYVISFKPCEFCKENFDQSAAIKNQINENSLYISLSAIDFGTTKSAVIDNLWHKYEEVIKKEIYSWKSLTQSWEPFSSLELEEINNIWKA